VERPIADEPSKSPWIPGIEVAGAGFGKAMDAFEMSRGFEENVGQLTTKTDTRYAVRYLFQQPRSQC
jgi:hypothetical protein